MEALDYSKSKLSRQPFAANTALFFKQLTTPALEKRGRQSHRPASFQFTFALVSLALSFTATGLGAKALASVDTVTSNPGKILLVSQATGSDFLQLQDSGNDVAGLQTQLSTLGYYRGSITGVFDSATQAAVLQFQQENGLSQDGIVGPETQTALQRLLDQRSQSATAPQTSVTPNTSNPNLLQLNDRSDRVSTLQTRLQELNYYDGPISGVFGPLTQESVIRFQQANGLEPDGIVGPVTSAALNLTSVAQAPQTLPPPQFETPTPQPSYPQTSPPQTVPYETGSASGVTSSTAGVLRRGDTGPAVATLQRRLRELGFYNGTASGEFDARTEDAVKAFQRSRGLTSDGIVGNQTSIALRLTDSTTPEDGPFSVLALQRRLRARGLYSGPLDGVLGTETRTAIQAAQTQFNLSEADIVNGRF